MDESLKLRVDSTAAERAIAELGDAAPRVLARTLNRSLGEIRTLVKRGIAADLGLAVGQVDKSLGEVRATFGHLVATLRVTGRQIPLIDFKARGPEPSRGRGRGVTYRIGQGGRSVIPDGFIATMKSGHRGVFVRVGESARKSRGAWSTNLPIGEAHGPSIPHVLGRQWIAQAWQERGDEIVLKNLTHETDYALKQAGKGGVPS